MFFFAQVRELGYMTRLGMWGAGTPFDSFTAFCQTIDKAGVGAMELLAMDMKSRGLFVSRMLAFTGLFFFFIFLFFFEEPRPLPFTGLCVFFYVFRFFFLRPTLRPLRLEDARLHRVILFFHFFYFFLFF